MSKIEPLVSGAKKLGITLTDEQIRQFLRFQDLLIEWNKHFNLTAVIGPQQIQKRHFLDSLTCVLATGDLNGKSLIDVGTGAGFPGLPLKICYPDLDIVLLESIRKKAAFLEMVVKELKLSEIRIASERAETFGHIVGQREAFDWAVARAVAPLRVLVEYLFPFVRLEGSILAQKGMAAAQELNEAQNAIATLGGEKAEIIPVDLAGWASARLVKIIKVMASPQKYPRRPGVPAKRPL